MAVIIYNDSHALCNLIGYTEFGMKLLRSQRQITRSTREKAIICILLSFCIPLALILIALAGLSVAPFGDQTLLISDANGLYINTLSYASRMYRGLEGVLYSFEKGLGGNMTGHLNGILLTPFAFLLSFSRLRDYPTVFTFISALNFSLAGLTMYLFLASVYGHKRSNLIFSTSYALMGFSVANVFQACFFAAAPVLPIMALGLRRLFLGKSPLLYILSVAYGLFSNFFFGFVLCVASVLFFAAGMLFGGEELRGRRKGLLLRYALSSLCGGLLVAALWLPAFLSLRGGRLDQTVLADFSFRENMPFLEMGAKLFTGAHSTSELVDGLPNLFVGILPVALAVLFFISARVDKRKKRMAAFLLGFYLLTYWIMAFNMLMHGGTVTNWFNYRNSYVVSFLLLVVAAELWEGLEEVPGRDMKRCLAGMLLVTAVIFSKRYEFIRGGDVLLDYVLLLLVWLAWHMHKKQPEKNPKHLFEIIALVLVCVNLTLNYRICTKNVMEWSHVLSEYQDTVDQVEPLVNAARNSEEGFWRMEVNKQRSATCGNDPMLYGYDGVGHGGSNERDFVRTGLSKLGVPWYDMRNYYADGVPAAADDLLGIRFVIAEEDLTEEKGYLNVTGFSQQELFSELQLSYDLYRNPDALGIAFLSGGGIDAVETDFEDVFGNLNRVWSALSGSGEPVFLEEDEISFIPRNFTDPEAMDARRARELVSYYDAKASLSDSGASLEVPEGVNEAAPEFAAYIEYSFTADRDGPVYAYQRGGFSTTGGGVTPPVSWVGDYHAGDTVTGIIPVNSETVDRVLMEEYCGRFRAAYADGETLSALSAAVRERPVTLEKHSETRLSGTFTAESGQKLVFTIPWDEGWSFLVDGQAAEPHMVLGVFMALDVPEGSHSFEMRYCPAGLKPGLAVSAAALVLTLVWLLADRRRRGSRGAGTAAESAESGETAETAETAESAETAETAESGENGPGEEEGHDSL